MTLIFNNEKVSDDFPAFLRSVLEQGHITAYRLAKDTGLSEGHVSNLLSGRREATDDALDRIAPCVGLDAEELKARRDLDVLAERIERIRRHFPERLQAGKGDRVQKGREIITQLSDKKKPKMAFHIVGEAGAGSPIQNPEHGEQDEPC